MVMSWGVVGVGLAGRARARAILTDERCDLVGVVRGRFAHEFDVPSYRFEELVAKVDAVAICSPNAFHAEQVRVALGHNCHVLVEFPLALTSNEAAQLFRQAESKRRLLHVEHIELLLAWHQALKGELRGDVDITMRMTKKGTGNERPEQFFGACVARLHNLADLSPIVALRAVAAQPGRLEIDLELESGQARLHIEAGPDFRRTTTMTVHDRNHSWRVQGHQLFCDDDQVQLPSSEASLFARDHQHMMLRLLADKPPYVSSERVIDILRFSEQIAAMRSHEAEENS